jgi:hypothetical protein
MFTKLTQLHRDQSGSISIMSVFAALLLTMLLGMVMNVGRQVDGKIRMQNAADSAAYSGGLVIARGMNALSFSNHLLCDVFTLTAFLREARDRNAESFVPEILAAWSAEGPKFSQAANFPKFLALEPAILQKVPMEQQLVTEFSEWAAAQSQTILPLMETILAEKIIPNYQQAVVKAFPDIAQATVMNIAKRNGEPDFGRGTMIGAFWSADGQLVQGSATVADSIFPVVDPCDTTMPNQPDYFQKAKSQRDRFTRRYLNDWNNVLMGGSQWWKRDRGFMGEAKMCQFEALWRGFTRGQLRKLIEEEYPNSNLPFMIRFDENDQADPQAYLKRHFTFLGVVYWRKLPELMPGLFKNPAENDSIAYAEVHVFVPRPRLIWYHQPEKKDIAPSLPDGGSLPSAPVLNNTPEHWEVAREPVPISWSLFNQHWTCQIAPATHSDLALILQTVPLADFEGQSLRLPNLGNLSNEDIQRISPH